ncbi:Hpt domain-containing protein [Oceanisphaera avium]|uniref:HPt domain-containing protein n=1 Tax=Oceanisphaera avium TaxID=1903694 RepID=A0A1Y0CW47_9GAMM|nr:Hpt domain-containing protein [Oceanisphaera avium]ART79522.1 hypothetical protein CBP12_04625 [Oceanisphaera avium]
MLNWQQLQDQLPLLDNEQLSKMSQELGEPVLLRLLAVFLNDGQTQGQVLAQAYSAKDYVQMARSCHSLTAACGSYGAVRCQFLSEKLEQSAKQLDEALINQQFTAWQMALSETLALVKERLHQANS